MKPQSEQSSTRKSPRTPLVALSGKSLILKHQSLAHDKLRRRATDLKQQDITEAVNWCKENGKRGWAAVHSGLFPRCDLGCSFTATVQPSLQLCCNCAFEAALVL